MKIKSLELTDFPPIKNLKLENLGNVVIIAGANGSGKTRLKQAIVQALQGKSEMNLDVQATREQERDSFGREVIEIKKGVKNSTWDSYIGSRRYGRGNYVGSLVQIDSQRNIQTVQYNPVNWLGADPDEQETSAKYYFGGFSTRWQEFINYIYQKSAVQDKKIAAELKNNPTDGENIIKNNPNPLEKYKKIFSDLLPGKVLQDINIANPGEFFYKDESGSVLPFSVLSSGEQEVVKVIFDIAQKDIKHSVILVDEPELHLHPTLTFKLIETLKSIGEHTNQFIFLTHSADLISTYYSTGDVYFIDAVHAGSNQAHKLSELNHSHPDLVNLMGENLGLFAVGKKLVFVEGVNSSIDRLVYHAIAKKYLPEARIIPVGSVENLVALNSIEQQIRNAIFGINFYMIRDRDGLSDTQISAIQEGGRIRCLKRRHIENYFLDAEVLLKVAEQFCLTVTNPLLTKEFIEAETQKIAVKFLKLTLLKNTKGYLNANASISIPTVRSVETKTTTHIKDEMTSGVESSLENLALNFSSVPLGGWMEGEDSRLEKCMADGSWREQFLGKEIFSEVCASILKEDSNRVKQAYVDIVLNQKPELFDDIREIFSAFE